MVSLLSFYSKSLLKQCNFVIKNQFGNYKDKKMKTTFLLCVVAALAAGLEAAVVKAPARANLSLGSVVPGDRLLTRQYLSKTPIYNAIQYQDFVYRGNYTTRITAIMATEVGYTQWATANLINGGIGRNNATVRVQSAIGYGYYYQVDIWGR